MDFHPEMRRGIARAALVAASILSMLIAFAPASSAQSPPEQSHGCSASSRLGGGQGKALVVKFRCNISVLRAAIRSNVPRMGVRSKAWSPDSDGHLACEGADGKRGWRAVCKSPESVGQVRPTAFSVALRVKGNRCDAKLSVRATGGVICQPDEACIDIGLIATRKVSKPAACA